MLGWQFFVMHREGETAFASWFSGLGGTKWIRNLAAEGKATVTAEGGYPTIVSMVVPPMSQGV